MSNRQLFILWFHQFYYANVDVFKNGKIKEEVHWFILLVTDLGIDSLELKLFFCSIVNHITVLDSKNIL